MSWLKRTRATVPAVPNDAEERHQAIQRSQDLLKSAEDRQDEVERVVAAVTAHDFRNHYRDRLYMLYGRS